MILSGEKKEKAGTRATQGTFFKGLLIISALLKKEDRSARNAVE
jgi:hypothetical protein